MHNKLLIAFAITLLYATSIFAQNSTGKIVGTVSAADGQQLGRPSQLLTISRAKKEPSIQTAVAANVFRPEVQAAVQIYDARQLMRQKIDLTNVGRVRPESLLGTDSESARI